MDKIVFLDVETTGLDPAYHEIIEICLIRGDSLYHRKVQPLHIETASKKALEINGYNPKAWSLATHPSTVALEIAHYLSGATIVAHNPSFDMGFIDELLHQYGVQVSYDRRLIDTTVLAHEHLLISGCKKLSMDGIREFFGWSSEGAHTAVKDCMDVRRLYRKLLRASVFDRWNWRIRRKYRKKISVFSKRLLKN